MKHQSRRNLTAKEQAARAVYAQQFALYTGEVYALEGYCLDTRCSEQVTQFR